MAVVSLVSRNPERLAEDPEFARLRVCRARRADGGTRANRHCTLLVERDVGSLLEGRRRENAQTPQIASSLFRLHVPEPLLLDRRGWYEAGKIHEALSGDMVRSKSEVIIGNLLHKQGTAFYYEKILLAGDGTIRLPDFTLSCRGETY